MLIGLIGAGNMARAMAVGWGRPLVVSDPDRGRASALAEAVGGEAVGSNSDVAEAAEVIVLCHKPAQLAAVASEIHPKAQVVISILGGVAIADVRAAYPDAEVYRAMPSTPVELRQGVVVLAAADTPGLHRDTVRGLLGELGTLIELPEHQVDAAMQLMSCGPAYDSLVAEAQIEAGVRRGLPPDLATEMVIETMAGTAALLRERGGDTHAVRAAVTSPGGLTARGLAALERGGIRAAFHDAIDAVLDA